MEIKHEMIDDVLVIRLMTDRVDAENSEILKSQYRRLAAQAPVDEGKQQYPAAAAQIAQTVAGFYRAKPGQQQGVGGDGQPCTGVYNGSPGQCFSFYHS